jgi:hypothetical protein
MKFGEQKSCFVKKAKKVLFSIKAYTSDFGQIPVKGKRHCLSKLA